MADLNSRVIVVRDFVPPAEWSAAPDFARRRYIERCAELAKVAKLEQVRRGIGADGEPLMPRIRPRRDGATGKPLDPHFGDSRSAKWARATPGYASGTVTIWWSHGWGRILGYHARGQVNGTYLRDILDFSAAIFRRFRDACRHFWRGLIGGHAQPSRHGPKAPQAPPIIQPYHVPIPRRPLRRPAARPQVFPRRP